MTKPLDRLTYHITLMGDAFQNIADSIDRDLNEQKRNQKHIDRLAWEAERRQRYQKGGHFK